MSCLAPHVGRLCFLAEPVMLCRTAGTVLCMLLAQSCFAGTGPDCPEISKQLGMHDAVWDDLESMSVGGVALCAAAFSSSLSTVRLAQSFTATPGIFDRVLNMPGQLVMSGVRKKWHWIAMIRTVDSGSMGYVSTMYINNEPVSETYSWLPPYARTMFSHAENVNDQWIHQHGYQISWPEGKVHAHINTALTRQGWISQSATGTVRGQSSWQRAGERLTVLVSQGKFATSLLVQHATQEATQ